MRVGVNVTPSIGSNIVTSRGSAAPMRAIAPTGSLGSSPSPRRKAAGSSVSAYEGWRGAKPLEQRRHLQQRVVAHLRHRRVAGDAVGRDGEAEDALLGAADAVAAPAAVLEDRAAALVEQQVAADLVGVRLGDPLRAERAAGLLVDDARRSAARRAPGASRCARARRRRRSRPRPATSCRSRRAPTGSRRRCRRTTGRASTPRRSRAPCRRDRGRQSVGPSALAAQPRDEVRALGRRAEQLALEAGRGEVRRRGTPAPRARCRAG